jgi:hypothetical protein
VDDVLLTWGTDGSAFVQCFSITTALLRSPTSGATEGAVPLGLALLVGGGIFLLLLLAGLVFWRARQTRSK